MRRYTYTEFVEKYGKELAEAATQYAEPTSRLMYAALENPAHMGKREWAAEPIETEACTIRAYFYLTPEEEEDTDSFDWEKNAEYEVDE